MSLQRFCSVCHIKLEPLTGPSGVSLLALRLESEPCPFAAALGITRPSSAYYRAIYSPGGMGFLEILGSIVFGKAITRTASLSAGLSASSHSGWAPGQPHPVSFLELHPWVALSFSSTQHPSHRQSYFSPRSSLPRKLCLFPNQIPGWPWISQASVNM